MECYPVGLCLSHSPVLLISSILFRDSSPEEKVELLVHLCTGSY